MSPRTTRRRTTRKKKTAAARSGGVTTGWHLGTQVAIAVSAMAVLALLGVVDRSMFSAALGNAKNSAPVVTEIGLQHETPAAVDMLVARKGDLGYVDVNNTSAFPLKISLPETWERTSVRGGSIWLVTQEDPEMGFVRWTLPAKMGMTLRTKQVPDSILFHSPSGQTASVRITSVNVATDEKFEHSLLFQNTAEAKIWTDDE
jgi:hypothetical protein